MIMLVISGKDPEIVLDVTETTLAAFGDDCGIRTVAEPFLGTR